MKIQFNISTKYYMTSGINSKVNTNTQKSVKSTKPPILSIGYDTAKRIYAKRREFSISKAAELNKMFVMPDDLYPNHGVDSRFSSGYFDDYYKLSNLNPDSPFAKVDVTDINNMQINIETGEKTYLSKEEHANKIEQLKEDRLNTEQSTSYKSMFSNLAYVMKGFAKEGYDRREFEGSASTSLYIDQRIEDAAVMYSYYKTRLEQENLDTSELDKALKDAIKESYGNGLRDVGFNTVMSEATYGKLTDSIFTHVTRASEDYKNVELDMSLTPTEHMFNVRGDGSVVSREPLEGVLSTEDIKLFAALNSSNFVTGYSGSNEELLGVSLGMTQIMYEAASEKASETGKAFLNDVFNTIVESKIKYAEDKINDMVGASFTGGLLYDPLDRNAVFASMDKIFSSYSSADFSSTVMNKFDSILSTIDAKMEAQYNSGNVQGRYAFGCIPCERELIDTKEFNRFMDFIGKPKYQVQGSFSRVDFTV